MIIALATNILGLFCQLYAVMAVSTNGNVLRYTAFTFGRVRTASPAWPYIYELRLGIRAVAMATIFLNGTVVETEGTFSVD